MSFIEAIKSGFQNYFNFTGKARRSEFWYFYLFVFILSIVAQIFDRVAFGTPSDSTGLFGIIVTVLTFIPVLSATFRRLADAGKSWANILWVFLPLVGIFILIYKLAQRSEYTNSTWS